MWVEDIVYVDHGWSVGTQGGDWSRCTDWDWCWTIQHRRKVPYGWDFVYGSDVWSWDPVGSWFSPVHGPLLRDRRTWRPRTEILRVKWDRESSKVTLVHGRCRHWDYYVVTEWKRRNGKKGEERGSKGRRILVRVYLMDVGLGTTSRLKTPWRLILSETRFGR